MDSIETLMARTDKTSSIGSNPETQPRQRSLPETSDADAPSLRIRHSYKNSLDDYINHHVSAFQAVNGEKAHGRYQHKQDLNDLASLIKGEYALPGRDGKTKRVTTWVYESSRIRPNARKDRRTLIKQKLESLEKSLKESYVKGKINLDELEENIKHAGNLLQIGLQGNTYLRKRKTLKTDKTHYIKTSTLITDLNSTFSRFSKNMYSYVENSRQLAQRVECLKENQIQPQITSYEDRKIFAPTALLNPFYVPPKKKDLSIDDLFHDLIFNNSKLDRFMKFATSTATAILIGFGLLYSKSNGLSSRTNYSNLTPQTSFATLQPTTIPLKSYYLAADFSNQSK